MSGEATLHLKIPPASTGSPSADVAALQAFRKNRDNRGRQRHRDDVTDKLEEVASSAGQVTVTCPVVDCEAQVGATALRPHLETHRYLFFEVWLCHRFAEDRLGPHYAGTPVDPILLRLIDGTAAEIAVLQAAGQNALERFVWPIGDYLVVPDPIDTVFTGEELDLNGFANSNGLHYNAWWVDPSLRARSWWAGEGLSLTNGAGASLPKPPNYKHSIMDLGVDDADQIAHLTHEVRSRIAATFGVDGKQVEGYVHWPFVERLSTFHIHFKYLLPNGWSNSSRPRVSPIVGDIVRNLRGGSDEYRYTDGYRGIGGQPAHLQTLLNARRAGDRVSLEKGSVRIEVV